MAKSIYIEYSYEFKNTGRWTKTSTCVSEKLLNKKLQELKDKGCEVHKITEIKTNEKQSIKF